MQVLCVFSVTHHSSAALSGDTASGLHGRGLSLLGNNGKFYARIAVTTVTCQELQLASFECPCVTGFM